MKRLTTPEELKTALLNNGMGLSPTDTISGIIAAPTPQNATRIRILKKRSDDMGFVIVLPNVSDLNQFTDSMPVALSMTLAQYWPAPLTAILPKHPNIPLSLTGGKPTIAIRVPATQIPPIPIISTSANYSGDTASWTDADLPPEIQAQLDFIYTPHHMPTDTTASTIVDFTQSPPKVVRQGTFNLKH